MREPSGDRDLLKKSRGAETEGDVGLQHFQRYFPPVFHILGEQHDGHSTPTELALDAVPVTHSGPEPGPQFFCPDRRSSWSQTAQLVRHAVEATPTFMCAEQLKHLATLRTGQRREKVRPLLRRLIKDGGEELANAFPPAGGHETTGPGM